MAVRRVAHAMSCRHRLHRRDLPGRPDLVFPGRRAVIFVHGCFRHGHDRPKGTRRPAINRAFWNAKLGGDSLRDEADITAIEAPGWRAMVVRECELRDADSLRERLTSFLGARGA